MPSLLTRDEEIRVHAAMVAATHGTSEDYDEDDLVEVAIAVEYYIRTGNKKNA